MSGTLTTRIDGAVAHVLIDNLPKRNAMTLAMWQALPRVLEDICAVPEVRVIILEGAGHEAFVSGADISEFETVRSDAASSQSYEDATFAAMEALRLAPLPTIAAIRGYCMGGGLGLALSCDLRLARADAVFAIPAAKLGVGYAFAGVKTLVDVVGAARAREILYTARRYDAEDAARCGLVTRVIAGEDFEAEVAATAQTLSRNAPLTIAAAKRAIEEATNAGAADTAAVSTMVKACFASADYAEGRKAFLEKRAPEFKGT